MHDTLIFSFVSYHMEKTKEHVHFNKEVCQDLKNKESEQNDTLSEQNDTLNERNGTL